MAQSEIEAEPHTLTRLMNAHVTELARDYGVLYRSGKRTAKGRPVYLKDIREELEADVANVGNDAISDEAAGDPNSCISYTTAIVKTKGAPEHIGPAEFSVASIPNELDAIRPYSL